MTSYREALKARIAAAKEYTGIDLDKIDVLVDEFEEGGRFNNHAGMLKILRELRNTSQLRIDVELLLAQLERVEAALNSVLFHWTPQHLNFVANDTVGDKVEQALASLRAVLDAEEK